MNRIIIWGALIVLIIITFGGASIFYAPFKFFDFSNNTNLDTSDTLVGIDSNGDGVRDDIENYIETKYGNMPATKEALRQYYRALEQALVDYEDADLSYANALETERAQECLWYIHGTNSPDIRTRLQAKILNTEQRSLAYIEFDSSLSGKSFSSLDDSKSGCDFDVENLLLEQNK